MLFRSVIEVLLYAIARKLLLIPKTSSMLDLVLGVVAIAGIFAIKKFLINEDKKEYNEITNLDEVDIDKPLEEAK